MPVIKFVMDQVGFKTDRKLVVICSDDWGSMRLKDRGTREQLMSLGLNLESNRFDRFDCMETNEDVEMLFEVLSSYRDYLGNHPVITALTNVANPDFEKIRRGDYRSYFYNDISETYRRYPGRERVLHLFQEGIQKRIFVPQFHGREHLQVTSWMKALASGDNKTRKAFEHDFFFLQKGDVETPDVAGEFAEAFNLWDVTEIEDQRETLISGINLFKSLFSYTPIYFTAPALIFRDELSGTLRENGVNLIDVPKLRLVPVGEGRFRRKLHYIGQENSFRQRYVTRNSVFETNMPGCDIDTCLSQIDRAFRFRQPAIISNHRASFVGGIRESNRTIGLQKLDQLLVEILKRWPDVEFIGMDQLSQLMHEGKCRKEREHFLEIIC